MLYYGRLERIVMHIMHWEMEANLRYSQCMFLICYSGTKCTTSRDEGLKPIKSLSKLSENGEPDEKNYLK